MPVVAVVGAIAAVGIAAADIAAVGLTVITALEVVTAVGATVGAIGAITGNKALSYAGMALGVIGGVGALATSAGVFGAEAAAGSSLFGPGPAASTASGAETGATFADSLTPATAGTVAGGVESGAWDVAAGGMSAADAASSGTINFMASATGPDQAVPSDLTTLSTTSENVADPATSLAGPNGADKGLINSDGMLPGQTGMPTDAEIIPPPTAPPSNLGAMDPATGKTIESAVNPVTGKIDTMPDGSPGVFGSILKFAKDNPTVTMGVLKAGGSFLEGATSTLTPAQVAYYNAKAAEAQTASNLTAQQTRNLAAPKAVASSAPVTGAPGPLISQPTGLINNAPRLAPVTGVPT